MSYLFEDDMAFCASECDNTNCFRHPSNMRNPYGIHTMGMFKETKDCPFYKEEKAIEN